MRDEIQYFVTVVEHGSISHAARELGVTPSTVSKKISKLEQRLQAPLLYRNTRGISQTDAGRIYYERIKDVLQKTVEADREIRDLMGSPKGVLKIAAGYSFSRLVLSKTLVRYRQNYPDVSISFILIDDPVLIAGQGIDVCFQWGDLKDSSLIGQRLLTDRIHYVCSSDFARTHEVTTKTAASLYPWFIAVSPNCATETIQPQKRLAVATPAIWVNNADMARELALLGGGITALPSYCVMDLIAAGKLVDLSSQFPELSLDCHAVFHSTLSKNKKISEFIQYVREDLSRFV